MGGKQILSLHRLSRRRHAELGQAVLKRHMRHPHTRLQCLPQLLHRHKIQNCMKWTESFFCTLVQPDPLKDQKPDSHSHHCRGRAVTGATLGAALIYTVGSNLEFQLEHVGMTAWALPPRCL